MDQLNTFDDPEIKKMMRQVKKETKQKEKLKKAEKREKRKLKKLNKSKQGEGVLSPPPITKDENREDSMTSQGKINKRKKSPSPCQMTGNKKKQGRQLPSKPIRRQLRQLL